jgi:hypothetical protein
MPDWKAIETRLEADKKYYDGVLTSFSKHPIEPVGSRSPEQQRAAIAEIVNRLDAALAIVKERLRG